MKKLTKLQWGFLIGGIILFIYSIRVLGGSVAELIHEGFSWRYMWLYIFIGTFALLPVVWRWQAILWGYGAKIKFWTLLKIQLAGFALSYVTPSARYGGEPLRIYMLKKECGVEYKTGTASIFLDKYIEYAGALTFGVIGLFLLSISPNIPQVMKTAFMGLVIFSVVGMTLIYHRVYKEKGFFYNIVKFFVSKKRMSKMASTLKELDEKMSHFVIHQKKAFFLSYFAYVLSAGLYIVQFKYLLLSIGVESTLIERFLMIIVVGLANLVPLPMALGSMEVGQAGLLKVLKGNGGIGLFISLVEKVKGLIISAVGFLIIINFGGSTLLKADSKIDKLQKDQKL